MILRRTEQLEHILVAGSVNCGRTDDRPIQTTGFDKSFGLCLGSTVGRKLRFASRQRGGEDETLHAGFVRSIEEGDRAINIGSFERIRVGSVGQSCDMDDAIRAGHKASKRSTIGQAAFDPRDILSTVLRAPCQGAHLDALSHGCIENGLPDESRGTGQCDDHDRTM